MYCRIERRDGLPSDPGSRIVYFSKPIFDEEKDLYTHACPRVMVLNTLKIITPMGFPGIMNPARKGDKTLSAANCFSKLRYNRSRRYEQEETYKV